MADASQFLFNFLIHVYILKVHVGGKLGLGNQL